MNKLDLNNKPSYKQVFKKMFSIKEDAASHEEIKTRILSGGQITGTNMIVMVCAILIASVGLNTDSVAVIIGAMLISPLMGSILAMAYGTVSNDGGLAGRHAMGFAIQIIISVAVAILYFTISPVKDPTDQLMARTSPRFFDVIIATAGGIAGIVGQTRQEKFNNIIPGVAIATALMPPLCTCGYSIANGEWRMLIGAAYLFVINAYFIYMSSCFILAILKIPQTNEMTPADRRKLNRKMIRNTIVVLLPMILIVIHLAKTQSF
ncbi:MAG: DUF389 domain-containing protein [Lachnospiraceae bacterium]|nr:DUF389 domain-containing protein [Lachnospiraceae bacterium]